MSVNSGAGNVVTGIPITAPSSVNTIAHSMHEYGAISVILSFVLLLVFVYFWKLINQRSQIEKRFDRLEQIMNELKQNCDKIKTNLLELKYMIKGRFRNKGWEEDDD